MSHYELNATRKFEILIEERKKYNTNFQWPIPDIELPHHGRRQYENRVVMLQ